MRFSIAALLLSTSSVVAAGADLPMSHPVLENFSPHFRCPHAKEWISKGPQQALEDLNRRQLQQTQTTIMGSCSYSSPMGPACFDFRGSSSWTMESMTERCQAEQESTLDTSAAGCDVSNGVLHGYCVVVSSGTEATPLMNMPSCSQAEMICGFMSGTFEGAGDCAAAADDEAGNNSYGGGYPEPSGPVTCAIAPGAIGAAHQAAYSDGYDSHCPGTPAEGSPYMWPLRWSAHVESKSLVFGSDDVVYHSKGYVYYHLDKNWKRNDWYYQNGTQTSIAQGPCDIMDCDENGTSPYHTMVHRGNKMMFISWKNGTEVGSSDPEQIKECHWLDLAVIGNIRNDWFMDDRGDSTDVQYLGNQHVFHDGKPRLVKQWRKKDFANQYFVMSILENLEKGNNIHWPMTLNVPGEGFGDDFLQEYTNHSLLSSSGDDEYLFLLDEALEAIGGACLQMESENQGGPPTGEMEPIPSNLEVDPNAWFSNVYTYSPVWQPPMRLPTDNNNNWSLTPVDNENTGIAITKEEDVTILSCWNAETNSVQLTFEFPLNDNTLFGDELPWMALGYRPTEECLMNPREGNGDTKIILLSSTSDDSSIAAHHGILPKLARSVGESSTSSIYASLVPLAEKEGYANVVLSQLANDNNDEMSTITALAERAPPQDAILLRFEQVMNAVPDVMHMMYAIGYTPTMGYHRVRSCFELTEFPTCPSSDESTFTAAGEPTTTNNKNTNVRSSSSTKKLAAAGMLVGTIATCLFF